MKSSLDLFYKSYFILYSVLLLILIVTSQIRFDSIRDFDVESLIFYILLPIVSLLLSKLISFVGIKFGFLKDNKSTEGMQGVKNKGFDRVFYVFSFFTPFVSIGLIILFGDIFDLYSISDTIFIFCLEMLASYLIVLLFSFLFSRFIAKLNNNINPLYKIYLIVYPVILLILSICLYTYQNYISHDRFDYRVDRFFIFSLPLITTLLSFILGCIIALIKNKNKEASNSKAASKFASFGKLFLIASLVSTFFNTTLFLLFIDRTSFNFEYLNELLYYFFITSFILTTVIAFLIKPIVHYWKTSRITSILLAIVYAQVLLGMFYFGYSILEKRVFSSYYHKYYEDEYYRNQSYKDQSSINIREYEDFTESDTISSYESSEPEEEEKPFYLNFLWENSSADTQNVTNALQEVRDSFDYDVISSNITYLKESEKPNPIYKIVQYISNNRENINLSKLLRTYSDLITTVIPKSVYEKNRYDLMLKLLTDSYYDLAEYDENKEMYKMKAIYEIMYNSGGDYRDKFELIKPYISKYYRKKYDYFGSDFSHISDYQELVWSYSFWGRRYSEGNIESTKQVIDEIRDLYDDYDEEYY